MWRLSMLTLLGALPWMEWRCTPGAQWSLAGCGATGGLIDLVAVLRAVRPPVTSLDYYEYAFSLETTPESYRADVGEFDRLLGTVAFSKPER